MNSKLKIKGLPFGLLLPFFGFGSVVAQDHFKLSSDFAYPQMYRTRLKSETGIIPYRGGFYFIDSATREIFVDPQKINGRVSGKTATEYEQRFLPCFLDGNDQNFDAYLYNQHDAFEAGLLSYIQKNPASFVALWFLIDDFSDHGYSDGRAQMLASFSPQMKNEKLWKLLNVEFKSIRIKMGQKFPALALQNTALQNEAFVLPKAKFMLIDFWFS